MNPKIIITDKLHEKAVELAKTFADVDEKTDLTPKQLISEIKGYDAIIIRSGTKVTREVIEASHLKAIGRAGVGLDNVDLEAAKENGVEVYNSPEASTVSVAEHTIGLMISLYRNIPKGDATLRENMWERKKLGGNELYGKTLGLVGFGRIGREVALRAKAFGMDVIAYDPMITSEDTKEYHCECVGLDDVFSKSDVISMHIPAIPETQNLVDEEKINLMKENAVIINTARGAVIDEQALYSALKDGKIKGAALDVYKTEPLIDSPLTTLDNVVLTPHLAASTSEAQINAGTVVVEKIRNQLN